ASPSLVGPGRQDLHLAAIQIVACRDDAELPVLDQVREHGIRRPQLFGDELGVRLHRIVEAVAGLVACLLHGRRDRGDERADVAGASPPFTAASTAPHRECPRTTTSPTPMCSAAYSMLASVAGSAMFPATRTTNRSPSPWSKTTSGGTRESEQPRMMANGCWPFATARRRLRHSRQKRDAREQDPECSRHTRSLPSFGRPAWPSRRFSLHEAGRTPTPDPCRPCFGR